MDLVETDLLGPQDMRPEIEVLLCCARTCSTTETAFRLKQLLAAPLNWDLLYTAATRHGMLPLMYWHLRQASEGDAANIPAHVLSEFEREFEENAARCFILTTELLRLTARFEAGQVRFAAYKGPTLALSAYGNLLLRSFYDLDILIEYSDLPAVHRILQELGYIQQFHSDQPRNEYAHSFMGTDAESGSIVVEVHWSVTPRNFALPPHPAGALTRLRPLQIYEQEVPMLASEDQLLVLCWHGYKHHWSRLEWIICIAEAVRRAQEQPQNTGGENIFVANTPALDWVRLIKLARQSGSKRVLLCGLALAQALLDAPLPEDVEREIKTDATLQLLLPQLTAVLIQWRSGAEMEMDPSTDSRSAPVRYFHLRSRERLRDKVLYAWRTILSPGKVDWRGFIPVSGMKRVRAQS